MDLVKKGLSYDTFQQHLGIVGDKSLTRIKHLHLCRNKLSALPSKMGIMVSLVEIRCTDNWLKFLPEELRNLPRLERLVVGGNQLGSIDELMPPEIRALKEPDTDEFGPTEPYRKMGPYSTLRTLRIGQNRISKLPLNFAQLFVNLKTLVANKNAISSLPVDLLNLPMLQVLVLSRNELSTLPPISNPHIRLRCLVLSKNQFEEVPMSIGKVKLLQKLYFDNNQIAELPKIFSVLKYMYKLDMSMNQLTGDTVLNSGLLRSATLHQLKLKPGNTAVPKDLSSKENFAKSPLASPLRRRGVAESPMSRASQDDDRESDYEDPSPRRVSQED